MSYIPKGCDQQGRHPEAAEAATEIGADEPDMLRVVVADATIAVLILAVVGLIVLGLM